MGRDKSPKEKIGLDVQEKKKETPGRQKQQLSRTCLGGPEAGKKLVCVWPTLWKTEGASGHGQECTDREADSARGLWVFCYCSLVRKRIIMMCNM